MNGVFKRLINVCGKWISFEKNPKQSVSQVYFLWCFEQLKIVINSHKLYLLGVLLFIFVAFLGGLHVLIVKINHDYDKLEKQRCTHTQENENLVILFPSNNFSCYFGKCVYLQNTAATPSISSTFQLSFSLHSTGNALPTLFYNIYCIFHVQEVNHCMHMAGLI